MTVIIVLVNVLSVCPLKVFLLGTTYHIKLSICPRISMVTYCQHIVGAELSFYFHYCSTRLNIADGIPPSPTPAGLFQPLDDFLRTSSVGEFFSRLQMVRAFAAHLRAVSDSQHKTVSDVGGAEDVSEERGGALANVLEGLWKYYEQVGCTWSDCTMYIFSWGG